MNKLYNILGFALLLALPCFIESCSPANGDNPGHEYMPDMGHAISYEANVHNDYSHHTWDDGSVKKVKDLSSPLMPIAGSIPRGYTGVYYAADEAAVSGMMDALSGKKSTQGIRTPVNGSVPYPYTDTEEERVRASREITVNPFMVSKGGLEKGKDLYNIYCGICHGDDGGGAGYLVRDDGKYPAQPANFLQDTFYNSSAGRFYHAIMYGKNVMGAYTDKLSYEERWQVIHYIRSLQAKAKNLAYEEGNVTFRANEVKNKAVAAPAAATTSAPAVGEAAKPTAAPAPAAPAGAAGHSKRKS